MFKFNLREAAIFRPLIWGNSPAFRFDKTFKKLFLVLFIVFSGLFLYGFIPERFTPQISSKLLGIAIIFLVFGFTSWIGEIFFNSKFKKPQLKVKIAEALTKPDEYNLAEFLSYEAARAIWQAINFSKKRKLPAIPSEAILYFLLEGWPEANFIFSRALLNLEKIKRELKDYLDSLKRGEGFNETLSPDSQKVILEAAGIAQKRGKENIAIEDIIISQSKIDPIFRKHLIVGNLKTDDIENLTWWLETLAEKITERKKFWEWKNLIKRGTIAKDWVAGFTITLDQFSADWTEVVKKRGMEEIMGPDEEVMEMERILSQEGVHNVLLIGDPGTGRKSVIHALTQKLLFGQSLPELNYKRVVSLDIVSILTRFQSSEEVEAVLEEIFQEVVSAGNIILVIDEFYSFVSSPSGRSGSFDISPIILRYLPLPNFRIIGITSFLGLHLFIEKNPAILNFLSKVEVSELTEEETIRLLENSVLSLEQKYKKFICYPTIRDIVKYSVRYIHDVPFPKKAIDLLEEVMTYTVRYTKSKIVLPEYVSKLVSKKTDIPVGELELREREILLNLESLIHQKIINQEEAVNEVSAALRRARADLTIRKGPMGCFLFLGPTGVGKTETAKALAEIYFGSENRMIRLDMSEFQNVTDIPRLIGSSEEEGFFTTQVRERPFSLILLDEIEKAHPNILNLFLQVLDEGHLTDGLGRKIDFKNSIIIATSNAGYQVILEALKKGRAMQEIKEELLDFLFKEGIFRPEFINRFDAVIVFKSLTKENLLDIAELLLQKLKKNLKEKEIEFVITQPLKEKITELGYRPIFGAREMRRVIQDKIENVLASALLSGQLKRGDKVEIDPTEFKLKIN